MLPTARLTDIFVPQLSQPRHISLQLVRWLTRRPSSIRPPWSPQCRSLHLYKTARAVTVLGMHKIMTFERYNPPDQSSSGHRINIVKFVENEEGEKIIEVVAESLTLQQVWDNYIEPGKILRLARTIPKNYTRADHVELERRQTAQKFRDYVVLDAYSTGAEAKVVEKKAKKARGDIEEIKHLQTVREVHLLLQTPVDHFAEMMDKAYQFVALECPVEFDICIRHVTGKKAAKYESHPRDALEYLFTHFPHLRPDFILKSMPPETRYLVEPVSDGRHVYFVVGGKLKHDRLEGSDLTKRLFRVKQMAMQVMKEGRMQQLPRAIRSKLAQQGNDNYSPDSSTSRSAREEARKGALASLIERSSDVIEAIPGEKRAQWTQWTAGGPGNVTRYMVQRAKRVVKPRDDWLRNELGELDRWGKNTTKREQKREQKPEEEIGSSVRRKLEKHRIKLSTPRAKA